jgi:hypothetical protein
MKSDFLPVDCDSENDFSSEEDNEETEDFEDGNDSHPIQLNEKFNQNKLYYIIENQEKLKLKMRPECFENDYNPFIVLEKYLENSNNGVSVVNYKQISGGRYFAIGGLSLQSFAREIRHTIAEEYYTDIDIENAHPVILSHISKLRGIKIKYLDRYNKNRDEYLSQINADREHSKKVVLSLINGGDKDYNLLKQKPKWLISLKKEVDAIHSVYMKDKAYKNHKKKREKQGIKYNHAGSYINILLCKFENNILMKMFEFFGSPENAVLCFDGVMLEKNQNYNLNKCESYINKKLGIKVTLKIKPMCQGLAIPRDIPKYQTPEYNTFDFEDSYDYRQFYHEFNHRTFSSYEELDYSICKKAKKVSALILTGEGSYIKKEMNGHDIVRRLGNSNVVMFYEDNGKKKKITLESYLNLNSGFARCVCKLNNCSSNNFNIWTGFNARKVDFIDSRTNLMIDFIRNIWANNEEHVFNYIISWFANLLTEGINKTALAMVSKQGTGKGFLLEFIKLMLRPSNVCEVIGVNSITQKHNSAIQGKRLVVINEMSSTQNEFRANFDKLKSYITDPVITIEPKCVNPYQIDNIGNYVLFTNHSDAIVIESSDRRYAVFEMSDAKRNDTEYFSMLQRECFNQDVVNSFYTYLMDFKKVNLRDIPESKIKLELKELSKPTSVKFLEYSLNEGLEYIWGDETQLIATMFYNKFTEWARENNERIISNTKFGMSLRDHIEKFRKKDGTYYLKPSLS